MAATIIGLFKGNGDDDPLADPKALETWQSEQPTNDDLGLQEAMIRLLEDVGARQPKVTPARVQAVLELDRHSLLIQSRLLKQYLHPALSDLVRQRLWHANDDLARWFAYMYEHMFAGLNEFFLKSRAKALAPAVASRMFHYRGVQAKQGQFRYERWIPGRWKALHDAFAEAIERDVARVPYSPNPQAFPDQQYSAEEEYLQILLLQRVNSGNLTAAQVEVLASWLKGRVHLIALAPPPLEGDGFWIDLGLGDGLLLKKPLTPQGPVLYLDVKALHAEIAKDQAELAVLATDVPASPQQFDSANRLALLKRIDPLLRPTAAPIERRGQRIATDRAVSVAVGLAEIAAALHSSRTDNQLAEASERYRGGQGARRSVGTGTGNGHPPADADVIEYHSIDAVQAGWRMHDQSDSGCRLVSLSNEAARQKLGGVLGILDEADDRWKIGIVRRLKKLAGGRLELGIELIALHSVLISPRQLNGRDSGYSVDGIDIHAGKRGFDALYLPPNSTSRDGPRRSMLVPAADYGEGQRFQIQLGSTSYTVEFALPIERAKDWVWTRFAVLSRAT
jgi:hypothetical protein